MIFGMTKSRTLLKSILGISTSAILFFSGTPAFAAPINSTATIGYDSVNSELDFGLSVPGLTQAVFPPGAGKFSIQAAKVFGWSTAQVASSAHSMPSGTSNAVSNVGSGLVTFPLSEDSDTFAPITDPYISVCFEILDEYLFTQFYASTWACSASIANPNSSGGTPAASEDETPTPVSYAGPKISSFNLSSVAPGGSLVATGKRLNTVQSATIGGLAAGITTSADGMEISVPEALLPGTYDLVMQTSHGVLTHINAVVVRAKPELSVITIRGTGNSISEDLATELAAISELHSSGYNKIHCLVNMADASAAEAIAAAACDLLKLGSLADATTLTTLKSTFKGSGFWLRIYMAG